MFTHLAYVSKAVNLMKDRDLLVLLEQARARNLENDVTGMLLYKDGAFLQVLEGLESHVNETYGRILLDERHERIQILFKTPIHEREFAEWAMGFYNLSGDDFIDVPGYSDFWRDALHLNELTGHASKAKKLLLYFRANG